MEPDAKFAVKAFAPIIIYMIVLFTAGPFAASVLVIVTFIGACFYIGTLMHKPNGTKVHEWIEKVLSK